MTVAALIPGWRDLPGLKPPCIVLPAAWPPASFSTSP